MTAPLLRAHNLVRVVDLDPIAVAEPDPPLRFRIEVFESVDEKGRFRVRVWRYETFRVQPTFPQKGGRPSLSLADEEILVIDPAHDWNDIGGTTPDDAVRAALAKLREALGL